MIKLLLVEDEIQSLKSLKQKVLDLAMPLDIIGTANDADEAMKLIKDNTPDIVITDIMMPGKDGIALIEALKDLYPSMIFIISSGYHEFEYAKRAMKLGVEDYLLKPIDILELENCLKNSQLKIKQQQISLTDNVLSLFLNDTKNQSPFKPETQSFVIAYVITHNFLNNVDSIIHPTVPHVGVTELEKILSDCISYPFSCFNGIISNEKIIIIDINLLDRDHLCAQLNRSMHRLSDKGGYKNNTIYLSYLYQGVVDISSEINHCRKQACNELILGKSTFIEAQYNNPITVYNSLITNEVISLCCLLLGQNQISYLHRKIKELFTPWVKNCYPLTYVQKDLFFLTDSIKRTLSTQSVYEFDTNLYLENIICASKNYDDLCENYFVMLVDLFNDTSSSEKQLSADQLMIEAKKYLEGNLSNNITLQMLCDHLDVSQVYLCRVFKSVTGHTPIDFFTKLKIKKSKLIMHDYPQMSFKDIASMLGFNDPYYFSKVFKKLEGASPSEYKRLR
ncbi:MAG: response regulator [Oscillospiraceae bacterium]